MDGNDADGARRRPALEEGFSAGRLLGVGASAGVWLAVRDDDGVEFALKVPREGSGQRYTTFETRRELNILSRFDHENLLRLHTVLDTDQGPGLLMEYAPGQSLARLLAVRGRLEAGEAVTVLVGIASALAYLHARQVCHGDVSPGNVLFTAQGKPLLADLGPGQVTGGGGGTLRPESDVFALAALGWFILSGEVPPRPADRMPLTAAVPGVPERLAAALEAGLSANPDDRPDAAGFARMVFAAAEAEPLNLMISTSTSTATAALPGPRTRQARTGATGRGTRGRRRARSLGRPGPVFLAAAGALVAGTLTVAAVAVAAPEMLRPGGEPPAASSVPGGGGAPAAGVPAPTQPVPPTQPVEEAGAPDGKTGNTPGTPEAPAPSSASPAPTSAAPAPGAAPEDTPTAELRAMLAGDDPVQAVTALAELRVRAFSTADAGLLDWVNAPGSPAMEADLAEITKLRDGGRRLAGLAVEVVPGPPSGSSAGSVSGDRRLVPAQVSTSGYAERDAGGTVIRRVAALPRQELVLVLLRGGDGWRIEEVLPPQAG